MPPVVAAVLFVVLLAPATAMAKAARAEAASAAAERARPALAGTARRTPFTHFGSPAVLELRGEAGAAKVEFGSRADELVTRAVLRMRYSYSPALAEAKAPIRLTLNDQGVGLLPVAPGKAGTAVTHELEVDPRLVAGFNRLAMDFGAPSPAGGADPSRANLWADVGGDSELEIVVRALEVTDDLSRLPEPFFDPRDQRRLTLPFVFAAQPSLPALRAAAVVASWFGQRAAWRGARFPAVLDAEAPGHAVAFATNAERAAFLRELPPVAGPELRITTNPADGRSKLLLVLGRDGADLEAAAAALVLGSAALSGDRVQVKAVREVAPRAAYDVPGWVRVDRPMKLGELIDWPQQLEAAGLAPEPGAVRVDFRMPPDLVAWRGPGVPMRLAYRYTPPACAGESQLEVSINDQLLRVIALRTAPRAGGPAAAAPALPEAIADRAELFVPAYRLRGRNRLQFAFRFALRAQGECANAQPGVVRAVVDADSTIDFSGFPHHARLPNLEHFASVGFPFTRHADLSRTVAVLPQPAVASDIETLLAVAGFLGESTGHPATGLRVAWPSEEARLAEADLLVIGTPPRQALLDRWRERLPAFLSGTARRVSRPARPGSLLGDWLGNDPSDDVAIAEQVGFEGPGPLAAILGFESPVSAGHSVVALTAVTPGEQSAILDALGEAKRRLAMRGSAVFIHPDRIESLRVGPTYTTGFLPPWAGLWHWLSGRPLWLAAVAAIAATVLALAAWGLRRAALAWRGGRRA